MSGRKVVVLGIDGATFDIIGPLSLRGKLPNITRLMEEGVRGNLNSTTPPVSPVAWTSFMTGTLPKKHRIFDFSGKEPGTYRFTINTACDRRAAPLWSHLSDAGKRVLVIGVTMTYPPDKVNGYMISGLGAPPDADPRALAYPPEFGAEIVEKFGAYRMVPEADLRILHRSDREKKKYLEGIFRQIDSRVKLFQYMWGREEFDFSMLFFLDTDGISHYFWRYMDSSHRWHQAGDFADAIFRVYEKIDAAVGELMRTLEGKAGLFLVSDHGFGPMNRVLFLNNWLASRGHLVFRKPPRVRTVLLKIASIVGRRRRSGGREIDWGRTRAFFSGTVGNIFINLKGREPAGTVEPSEYDALCRTLADELAAIRDPESGEGIVDRVSLQGEMAGGVGRSAPDLVVTFRKGYGLVGDEIALHDIADTGEIVSDARNWSGNHEKEGIFIAHGEHFKKGIDIREAEIIDVAPTVLYTLGVPVPRHMDGRMLTGIFDEDFLKEHEVRFSGQGDAVGPGAKDLDDAEKEAIKDQLRNLGYIE